MTHEVLAGQERHIVPLEAYLFIFETHKSLEIPVLAIVEPLLQGVFPTAYLDTAIETGAIDPPPTSLVL